MTEVMRALQARAQVIDRSALKSNGGQTNSAKAFSELISIQKDVNHPNYKRLKKFYEDMVLIDSEVVGEYRTNYQFQRLIDSIEAEFPELAAKKAIEDEVIARKTAADLEDYDEVYGTIWYLTNLVVERVECRG